METVYLLGAVVAGAGAWIAGWPAWRDYRSREGRDENVERYNAWRGRANRGAPLSEGPTGEERRRFWVTGLLAAVALLCLAAFFAAS